MAGKAILQKAFEYLIWNPNPDEEKDFNLHDPNQKIDGVAVAEIFGGKESSTGESVTEDNSLKFSAVWACNRAIAAPISYLDVRIFELMPDGSKQERPEDYRNKLFKKPNNYQTWVTLCDRFVTHRNLWGNGLIKKGYDQRGKLNEFHLIHPSFIQEAEIERGELIFTIQNTDTKKSTQVNYQDVIHLPGLGDGALGKSVIQYAREDIGLEFAIQKYGGRVYKNGGDPRGLFTIKRELKPEQIKQVEDRLIQQLKRSSNLVVGVDADYKPFQMNPVDAEFIASRSFNVNTISRWFGVPPWKIAHLKDGATFNNIEQMGIAFLQDTLAPIVAAMENELNNKLFDEDENLFVQIDMDEYLRSDSKARSEKYRTGIQNGYMTINEVRKLNNLNPIDGGDRPYMQSGSIPIDKMDDFIDSKKNGTETNTGNDKE